MSRSFKHTRTWGDKSERFEGEDREKRRLKRKINETYEIKALRRERHNVSDYAVMVR